MELREKIARVILPGVLLDETLQKADAILDIPEIKEALSCLEAQQIIRDVCAKG